MIKNSQAILVRPSKLLEAFPSCDLKKNGRFNRINVLQEKFAQI
jgi:hypothetical protein